MPPGYFRAPADLLAELGIDRPELIDIEAIAQYCGATVVYERLSGCEARILGKGSQAFITVDSRSSVGRQRFSAAHELGHWMHDRGLIGLSCTERTLASEWGGKSIERRANRYAADLLLPVEMFSEHAREAPPTLENAEDLASRFRTSLSATAVRLVDHGSFPSMVVCTGRNSRKWFHRSPDLPETIWPAAGPEGGSIAARLHADPRSGTHAESVPARVWLEGADNDHWLYESSVVVACGVVLTLLWWEDEEQLIALEGEL